MVDGSINLQVHGGSEKKSKHCTLYRSVNRLTPLQCTYSMRFQSPCFPLNNFHLKNSLLVQLEGGALRQFVALKRMNALYYSTAICRYSSTFLRFGEIHLGVRRELGSQDTDGATQVDRKKCTAKSACSLRLLFLACLVAQVVDDFDLFRSPPFSCWLAPNTVQFRRIAPTCR